MPASAAVDSSIVRYAVILAPVLTKNLSIEGTGRCVARWALLRLRIGLPPGVRPPLLLASKKSCKVPVTLRALANGRRAGGTLQGRQNYTLLAIASLQD